MVEAFDGLGELRIDWGPGLRIYLAKDGDALVVLFGDGSKGTQARDVLRAKALLAEYKSCERARDSAGRKQRR